MKTKQLLAAVSGSALASGMAHGAVLYSGPVDLTISYNSGQNIPLDLNGDDNTDFYIEFSQNNPNKPYIQSEPSDPLGSTELARLASDGYYGFPVTAFGTVIDSNFLAAVPSSPADAYFFQEPDSSATSVGDWGVNNLTEGYVGLELYDQSGNTNFGWAQLIYNKTAETITLVDYAYETTPNTNIVAGATNEVGMPNIYVQPVSQSVGFGAVVQLSVTALANPPPIYLWQVGPTNGNGPYTSLSDGGAISGSTNATLTISGATTANQLDYRVIITNSLGAVTSTPAALTVSAPVAAPNPQVLFAGVTAHFNVSVAGGSPFTFMWQKNGAALSSGGRISGATTTQLQISNLQTTDAGSYTLVFTSASLSVTSTVSSLTVLPVASESLYDAAVLADGPVVYYRLNETGNPATSNLLALDNVGALNGTYGIDVTNGYEGVAGPDLTNGYPGFFSDNAAASFTPDDTNSQITLPPWNLNTDTLTFTFWVNQAAIQAYATAILWTGSNTATYAGIDYYYGQGTGAGAPGNVDLGYTWNEGGSAAYFFWDSGIMPPVDQWSMTALSFTSTNTILYVFDTDSTNIQGDYSTNQYFPFTNLVMALNSPETIGNNPNVAAGADGFNGLLSDFAVFKQALTTNQLEALYNAGLGNVPPVNPQISLVGTNAQISWSMGTLLQSTNISGPWTPNTLATSPFTIAPTGGSMFYQVVVP